MDGINGRLFSIEQATELYFHNNQRIKTDSNDENLNVSFNDILKQQSEIKFSKHANQRLASRNISLSDEQMLRLNQGVSKARDKSIKESLVMMDNLAFIVNIKSNTVVTALEKENESSVFTNIDGAVIV